MKLILEDNKIIIFLNKMYINNINLEENKETERFIRKLINRVKNKYKLDFEGYYNINIFVDDIYGFIVSIEKENLEYFDYFNGQIEFSVKIIKSHFLYKLEEVLNDELISKCIVYKNRDIFYLQPKEDITFIEMGKILENSIIIFNKKAKDIIQNSKIMKG